MPSRKLNLREMRVLVRKSPFNRLLGMRVSRLHPDGITIECKADARLANLSGLLHGGVGAALADVAVGMAIQRHLGGRRVTTTVEMKINYFRPVKKGRVFARSRLLRVGSTLCVGRVDIEDEQRRAVATALLTYMLLGAREGDA